MKFLQKVLYNIFIEFDIPIKLVKMCLSETYSRVQVGKHLSDTFCVKNGSKKGNALLPLLFDSATRKVQANQESLKLNGTHQMRDLCQEQRSHLHHSGSVKSWYTSASGLR
jgi:hypothetical protein